MINDELLAIICCPETKADLVLDGDFLISISSVSRRRYKIVDDIPVLLIDDSEIMNEEEWKSVMIKHKKPTE